MKLGLVLMQLCCTITVKALGILSYSLIGCGIVPLWEW